MFAIIVNADINVSVTEAAQDFSKVLQLVDRNGSAVIVKNGAPRYIVLDYPQEEEIQNAADEEAADVSKRLIAKNLEAYKELAK